MAKNRCKTHSIDAQFLSLFLVLPVKVLMFLVSGRPVKEKVVYSTQSSWRQVQRPSSLLQRNITAFISGISLNLPYMM